MKYIFTLTFLTLVSIGQAQNIVDWDGKYLLQLSDFQSPNSKIGEGNFYSLNAASTIDFSFYMSNAEFILSKNFNDKVSNSFNRDGAYIIAPDSATAMQLLAFAQYDFDLKELYARKFRKRMFDEKKAFSDINYSRPIYESVQKEYASRHALAGSQTDIGIQEDKLKILHRDVLEEIKELYDFCKTCKPAKKTKKK
ncbi:hypothetical protein [Anditalea andensis]|uniref:Uncharacterized protein n=1 Tax=Anditalea andensis TaxID=1048983 RepID=A0A074L5L8_9BACT|nr:hypothetical protein [Anditalea andensis]KEO75780.1 hypothetical protein EL17_22405 [Anditalea andensis]